MLLASVVIAEQILDVKQGTKSLVSQCLEPSYESMSLVAKIVAFKKNK